MTRPSIRCSIRAPIPRHPISKMGIVYYDLKTGKGFSINPDTQFRSASTAKLFVNMALYDRVDKGS